MYIPPHFAEHDKQEIEQLVHEFSFATLVSVHDNTPWATHIPLELEIDNENQWWLHGHVARANPQWKNFERKRGRCWHYFYRTTQLYFSIVVQS
jgi:transcriptional regulator